jgi:hypothetical protein
VILKSGTYVCAGTLLVDVGEGGAEGPVVHVFKGDGRIERAEVACPCGRTSTITFQYEDAP